MNLSKLRPLLLVSIVFAATLSGCGTVESAAEQDCTSIGWRLGSPGYESCFKARVRERKLDYSLPSGDKPSLL